MLDFSLPVAPPALHFSASFTLSCHISKDRDIQLVSFCFMIHISLVFETQPVDSHLLASSFFLLEGRRSCASRLCPRQCVLYMRTHVTASCCVTTAIFSPGRIKAVVVNSLWRSRLLNTGAPRITDCERPLKTISTSCCSGTGAREFCKVFGRHGP